MPRLARTGCLALWLLSGCPRDLQVPEATGKACEVDADCNTAEDGAVLECGRLRACVHGHCESGDAGSLIVPCDG